MTYIPTYMPFYDLPTYLLVCMPFMTYLPTHHKKKLSKQKFDQSNGPVKKTTPITTNMLPTCLFMIYLPTYLFACLFMTYLPTHHKKKLSKQKFDQSNGPVKKTTPITTNMLKSTCPK